MTDFEQSVEVQTEYERGRKDGIAHMSGLADGILQRSMADELEIEALKATVEALKARVEDLKLRAAIQPQQMRDAIELTEDMLEAGAQALADDVWHPPIKLSLMAKHEASKFRRQALITLKAATAFSRPDTQPKPMCSCKASARDGQHMAWCPALTRPECGGGS